MDLVSAYIHNHWDDTIRYNPENCGNLIGLPQQYIVPCFKGTFQELYYWDTYFASRGLAVHGRKELIRSNVENFFYEVEKFGFIPNGSRTFYLNRSQPAFLGAMIKLTMELYPDDHDFKSRASKSLEQEIKFWDTKRRNAGTGLYHYGSNPSEKDIAEFFQLAVDRCGVPSNCSDSGLRRKIALAALAEAESGWDFTPRFEGNCPDCAAIDLNCLLWLSMSLLAKISGDNSKWQERADSLQQAIRKYCRRDDGVFTDYNFKTGKQVKVASAASLFPLWTELATAEEAAAARDLCCCKLEFPYGIASTEKCQDSMGLQWEYPNGWPCMQLIAFEALHKYGFTADAARIAGKYVDTVQMNFEHSGELWEKYNVTDGSIKVNNEYEMPSMMGWTAGTYLAAKELLARIVPA